jgi:V/A-type H+/Na+-transporting ATPase subunit C
MGTLLSYSGLSTKIRSMQSRLIHLKQFEEISQMGSVPQVVAYLKQQPGFQKLWADLDENSLHRGDIERLLRHTIYQNFTKIYKFSNNEQRTFLALYFKRYELSVMKACLRNIFDHRDVVLDLSLFEEFFARHSKLDLAKITASATIEEFIQNIKGSEYYVPLNRLLSSDAENPTVFDYSMALDQYYFSLIWKMKGKFFSGIDLEEITMSYGRKFDMLNLTWIYRSKRYYHMSAPAIYALLIPMQYKLHKEEITALVESADIDEFSKLLSQTYYGKTFEELAPETLEETYTQILRSILKTEARKFPHSVAVIYSYLYHKEHEVDRLITAVECVRYKVPHEEAMKHILKN